MKKVLSVLLVLTLILSLAACGNGSNSGETGDGSSNKSTDSSDKSTDNGTKSTDSTGDTGKSTDKEVKDPIKMVIALNKMPEGAELKKALEEVQTMDKYSNVEWEILPSQEEFNTSLPITIAAGEQRDLVAIANPIIQQSWANAGVIQPINDYVDEIGLDFEKEYGQFTSNATNNGELYIIPHALTKWALYYNKDVFDAAGIEYPDEKVPMTWNEYSDLAARLTSGQGSDKIYGTFHLTWPMFWYGEAIQKLGGGEHFYTEDGLSNIEDPIFAKALERTYKMQHVDKSVQTQADLMASKTTPTAFMNGHYGMTIAGAWILSWATDRENQPRDWEIGMAPLPVDEGTRQKTWGVVNGFGVGATSADPVLATEIALDLSRLCAKYQEAQEEANRQVESPNLYVGIGDELGDEGVTTEVIKGILANPDTIFVTEKIMGPNNVAYQDIIKEEVEKYFVQEQDLDTTIKNIKTRADKVLSE